MSSNRMMMMTTTVAATTIERVATPLATDGERAWSMRSIRRSLASIRVRIVVLYVLLLAGALAVAVVITRQVQLARVHREFEQAMAQEVEELRRLAGGNDPQTGEPFAGDVERIFDTFLARNVPAEDEAFYTLVGELPHKYSFGAPRLFRDPQLVEEWSAVDRPTTVSANTTTEGVGDVTSLAVPLVGDEGVAGVFVVAFFPDMDEREVNEVVLLIALSGLAVLAVTTALAWSLAGRVLRPARELTRTARRITESDLSARIPVEGHDELAELGDTFNEMVERLERGFRSQRRYLDDVAHELRTPITIARGHLEMLGDDPDEQGETVEIITEELDRMSRYVTDLLVLAKAEQPDFLELRPVDLGDLAIDLSHRVTALAPRHWVLDEAPPAGMIAVLADPVRLGQAMLNLAANATQHTSEGAEIGLGISVVGNRIRMWVRDTGPGVDPAVAGSLFDRHARSANSRSKRPEGSGIGLSIVDAIARAHGGSVDVESRSRGATFTITIPLDPEGARA
jgi:signal transduction histidine kinase